MEKAFQKSHSEIPNNMLDFINGGEKTLSIARISEKFLVKNKNAGGGLYPLKLVKITAPIIAPPMILNMGNAYRPFNISGYLKPITGIIGPNDPIIIPKEITDFGACFEVEIGIIIGKKGRRIPNDEEAYEYVYGYTYYNDITDYGKQITGMFGSKLHDTFCPMGPCIVTRDEIKNPHNLIKKAWVNGLLASESNTKKMVHKIHEFVSMPSHSFTLLPGTVISTGSPNTGRIKPGDILECEITKIGKMKNSVIAEI